MPTQRISFPGSTGSALAARLELPPGGKPVAYALFAHCFTCSKNLRAAVSLTRSLSSLGIGVLRFDFTGLGESDGDFAETNFSSNVEDLLAAARYMEREHSAPSILVGHSLGGAAVLHAAVQLPAVRAVCTIGAPADPAHVLAHIAASREQIERDGEATVSIGGRPFRIKKLFLDDLEGQRMADAIRALRSALLILHSPLDAIVPIGDAARLYEMARHPKSFVSLDDADHLLSSPSDVSYVGRVLAAWASKYIEIETSEETAPLLHDTQRLVTRTRTGSFFTEIRTRRHSLIADEPESVGGQDAGPTPYDYVVAGLGACTSMTLQMYATRKGWPLEEALVRLKHRRLHSSDSDDCEDKDQRLDVVEREVELVGPLDGDQRRRLMEIADRCPVHRTLDRGVRIRTTEALAGS